VPSNVPPTDADHQFIILPDEIALRLEGEPAQTSDGVAVTREGVEGIEETISVILTQFVELQKLSALNQ